MQLGPRTRIMIIVAVMASAVSGAWFAYRGYGRPVVQDAPTAVVAERPMFVQDSGKEFTEQRAAMEAWTDGRPFIITWGETDDLGDPARWPTFKDAGLGVTLSYPRDVQIEDPDWGDATVWSGETLVGARIFTWEGKAPDETLQAILTVEDSCDESGRLQMLFPRDTKAKNVTFDEVEIDGRTWQREIRMVPHVPEGASVNRGETVWYVDRLACRTTIVDAMYPGIKGRQRLVGMLQQLHLR